MANYNDVIEKNKRYLTQAQIDALVAASKQYNVENAGNRAGALSSARQQFDAGYRGLQNMGLAGATAAQPTSGEVPRLIQQVRTPVDDYNRRLQDVENKRLNALGGQFAQQTQAAWAAQAQREAEARARQDTLQQQYQRAQTVARVVNNKDIPSAPKLDPRTLVVESVKEFDAPTSAELAALKYQQDGIRRTAEAQQQAAINAAAALLGITVPNNMQQAEQARLDREAETARNVQNTVTKGTKPVLNQKTGDQYTYDTYTEAKEMQRAADDIATKATRAARANKTNDTTEQDERALKEAQANVDYIDSLYKKMAKGKDLTDAEIKAMSQERVAVQQRDLAKEKLENPEKYAARLVLSDPSKRGTSAWTKATQLMAPEIADNVLESMGISKPNMTDEQFTADSQKVKEVLRSLNVIDSLRQEQENKKKTGTTGAIDYDQQFIDEELETLKKLGYTEAQARKLVKRVSNERQTRSEYEYYYNALETEIKNDGLKPLKPVNQSETDTTYRYANNLPVISLPEYAPLAGPAEYMNDKQRNTYNALYETEGIEAANKYVEDITPILNLQRAEKDRAYRQEMVNKNAGNAIWQNILSVGTNLIGNVPAMMEKLAISGYNMIANPDVPVYIDQNSGLSQLSNRTDYIREATSEKILTEHPNTWRKVANFLYQSGMSMADSAAAMGVAGVLGNTHAVDVLFFSSAGNEAYRDARERGATQEQAMGFSILSGAAEAIFEHVSVETFADQFIRQNAKARRSTLAKLLIQSGTEASEEVTTEIANKLADAWVMGDKSEYDLKVKELMSQDKTLTKEQAEKKAFMDALKDVGMAGLGGLVSGLGFGLTGAIATKKRETKTGKAVKENGKLDRLTRAAKLFGGDVAQQAAEVEAGNQSDAQVGNLLHELQLAQNEALGIDAESNEQITESQAEEIAKKGEALDVIMEGEQITADDAQKVIDTLGADKLTKMGYDASSAEAFANSYNDSLKKQNIAPMSEVAKAEKEFRKNKAVEQLREESFDLVYKNPKQGLAYQYEGKTVTPMPGNMTAVEFAEHERANFKARTTAKMDGVTLELSGMEARQGLTDEQIFAEAKKTLTKKAARKLDAYMKISKALSLPMVIRDVVTGTSGYVHDGKLYVTLSGRQSVLRVVAHELTHQMKDLPGYASLRNRLIAEVGGQAEFDKLIEKKAQKYGLDLDTEKGREEADDEVCAELCERMLANEEALEKFAEKDTEAAKTLRDRLLKILNAIKDALKDIGNRDFGDSESDLIKEQETIEEWYKNLSEAIENVENKVASDELLLSEEDKANAARKQEAEALTGKGTDALRDRTAAITAQKTAEAGGVRNSLDTDYMRLAEKQKSGTLTKEDESKLRTMVDEAAEAAMPNSVARGKDGKLIKFFHGTKAEFTKFERSKIGSTGRFEGSGFNFTPYEGRARSYGGRVLEGYLNIQHPLSADKKTISVAKLAQLIRNIDPTGDNIIANYARNTNDYGTPSFIRRESMTTARALWEYNESDVDVYSDLSSADPDAESLIRAFSDMGYDGLIHYDSNGNIKTAVAFSSEQFKLADPVTYDDDGNIIPLSERFNTQKEDIRYDLDTDAIRHAFTVIDTEALDNGLASLKNVTPGKGLWAIKDISRFLDSVSGGDKDLRDTLTKIFETPHRQALKNYATGVSEMQQKVLDIGVRAGVCDAKGRHFDSKKSAAIQNIGEGFSNRHTDVSVRVVDADAVRVTAVDKETGKALGTKDYTFRELRGAYGREVADQLWSEAFDAAQEAGKPVDVEREVNTQPYTIDDLKAAYPDDWQKLKTAADEFRTMYDEYIRDINNMLETIYPNASKYATVDKITEAIEKKQQRLADRKAAYAVQIENLQKSLEEKEQQIASKRKTDTKAFRELVDQANRIKSKIAEAQAEIKEYEENVKDELDVMGDEKALMQNAEREGDSLGRMHRLEYRSDYFHHFTEMTSGVQNLKSIFTGNTDISPAVVGKSDQTKPKSRFAGFFQKRQGGDYTADALNGMLRYGQLAEYKLAFDPFAAYLRDVENKVVKLDKNATNRDNLIRYIQQWTNTILGKSHTIDRALVDSGIGMRSKMFKALSWINSRVIQNTLLWNMRSALIQISNVTNAKGIVTNNLDWANGLRKWALAARGNSEMQSIMNQSTFLASRYMDNLQLTDSVFKSAKQFAGWMLGALDEVSAKATWWAAYTQYQRNPNAKVIKNAYRTYDNAIDYADDVTRRTHAGRGVGELAPAMTSRVINLVAPFQVEVNNTYQLLKDNVKQKNYLGLLSTGLSVFALNTIFEAIVGSTPLGFDIIRAIVDIVFGFAGDDPNDDDDDYDVKRAAQRLAGEFVGGLPYANQIVGLIGKDNAEKILGSDTDVTRYGNTQIGLNAMMNTIAGISDIGSAVKEGKNLFTETNFISDIDDLLNIIMPMGAKQLTRTAEGLMTVAKGYGSKADKEGNEKVQFVADQDLVNWLHAGLFGKWALTQASEYFDEERLLPKLFGAYEGPKSATGQMIDAKEYKAALNIGIDGKDYFTLKDDLRKYTTQPGKRAEMMQQKLTPEQKAKLDALMFAPKDTEMKADGAVVYQMSSDGEWKVKADYTNQDLFDLSQAGDKAYTGTLEAMDKTGLPQDQAALAASMWDRAKEADDRKAEFRSMLRDNANLTVEQKEALDLQYCGNKYAADYSDPELYDLSVTNRATYEKAKQAKAKGVPVSTFTGLSDKKAAHEGDGQAAYMRGEIMKTNLTAKQKELLDDLLVSDKGANPDYSSQAWFDLSMLSKTQYDKAKAGAKVGVKPEVYLAAYKKYKEVNRKDKDGKYVNTKKEAKALLKAYMDKQPISAPVYDYIWTAVFGYKSR